LVTHLEATTSSINIDNLDFKDYEYKIVVRGSTNDDSTAIPKVYPRINGSNQYGTNYKFVRDTVGTDSDAGASTTYISAYADSKTNSSFQTMQFIQSRVTDLDTHIHMSVEISAIKRTGNTSSDVDLTYGLIFSGNIVVVQAGSNTGVGDDTLNQTGALMDSKFTYTFHPDTGMSEPNGLYVSTGLTQGTEQNTVVSLYRRKLTFEV
jgi:hypothetical protein